MVPVPVMDVGPMAVDVVGLLVDMLVAVGLGRREKAGMVVEMMAVPVDVGVGVDQALVP
jgi:hypothetical protein